MKEVLRVAGFEINKRRRRRRQLDTTRPINNGSNVMFMVNIRLDNVQPASRQIDVYLDPMIVAFTGEMVFQPFWPFSGQKFDIKVGLILLSGFSRGDFGVWKPLWFTKDLSFLNILFTLRRDWIFPVFIPPQP